MSNRLFNTPFELSLHVVMLLDTVDAAVTLDRIAAYDFMRLVSEKYDNYDDVRLFDEINRQSTKSLRR